MMGAVSRPSVTTGMPIEPNATGAVLASSASTAALIGSNPRLARVPAQMATGGPIPGQPGQRTADHVEVTTGDGQVVEKDRVEHDPADWPQPVRHAFGGGRDIE